MAEKFIHDISPSLTQDAQFRALSDIPSAMLTQGSTVRFYPGAYGAINQSLDNIALEGVGDKAEITIAGVTLARDSANAITFKNVTINSALFANTNATIRVEYCTVNGTNVAVDSAQAAIIMGVAGVDALVPTLTVVGGETGGAEFALQVHGTTSTIRVQDHNATGCDQGIISNSNVTTVYSHFGVNAAFIGGGASAPARPTNSFYSCVGGANDDPSIQTTLTAIA